MAGRIWSGLKVAAVALMLAAMPRAAAAVTIQQVADSTWYEARTSNFVVMTNAGPARARTLAQDLEDFRRLVIKATSLEIQSNPLPFHIVALISAGQLKALIDNDMVFGAFQQSYRGGLAAVNLAARAPDGTDSLSVTYTRAGPLYQTKQNLRTVGMDGVFHEYVHYLLEIDAKRRYPLWFHEGYAEYLSTFEVSDGRYKVGDPPMHRVMALEKTPRIPLGALLNAKGYETGHENSDFNAESWLAVHYLMSDPGRRAKLYAFLDRLDKPMVDTVPTFEDVFGQSMADTERALRQYRRMGNYKSDRFDRPSEPLPEPIIRQIPPDEAKEELAYTLLHFSPEQDKGVLLLNQALAANPANVAARALLAAVAITGKDEARAQAIIDQGGAAIDTSAELLCMKGELFLRQAAVTFTDNKPGWEDTLAKATDVYRRALAINPDEAQAMSGLARTWLILPGKPPDEIMAQIDRAQLLLPMNQEIELIAAHLRLKRGEVVEAVKGYEHVVAWARDPATARQARERLDKIYALAAEASKQSQNPAP